MEKKHCPSCGEELPISSTFCPACFKQLNAAGVTPLHHKKDTKLRIFIISAIILLIMALLTLVLSQEFLQNTSSPVLNTTPSANYVSQHPVPENTGLPAITTPTISISPAVSQEPAPTQRPTQKPTISLTPTKEIGTATLTPTPITTAVPTTTVAPTFTVAPTATIAPTSTIAPTTTVTPTSTVAPTKTPTSTTAAPTQAPNEDESLYAYRISNNKATITNYYGAAETVSIPATLGGAPVYEIATNAFFGNNIIQEVYIPNSVQVIGNSVFSNCSNLKSVYMEDSVTTLGAEAFSRSENLQTVRLSNNIKVIPTSCFSLSRKLHTVNMPTSLTTILSSAFSNTAITTLSLPATVTTLPNMFCVYMPELKEITVASGNTVYWSKDGVLFERNVTDSSSKLFVYPGGKKDTHYTVPAVVKYIYSNAFCKNPYIQTVTLSQQTATIYLHAFDGCTALTQVVTHNGLTRIEEYAFKNCTNLTHLNLTSYVTKMSADSFQNCSNLTLTVEEGSYAHTYAIDNNILYTLKQ